MKRVLIVADHSLVSHAIRLALRQTGGFRIVGYADGRQSCRAIVAHVAPEVVLIDDMRGADAIARIRDANVAAPAAQCLLLTLRMDDGIADEAFEAGATAVLSKTVHPAALGTLLRETVQGNVVHRPRPRPPVAVSRCPLTPRELEILRHAAEGLTNGQIAQQLWVTEQTVKFHLTNSYRKLGVANRTEASRYLHINDLVGADERLAS